MEEIFEVVFNIRKDKHDKRANRIITNMFWNVVIK
jgi:hypothetical protein